MAGGGGCCCRHWAVSFALEGVFEDGLTVDFELGLRCFQRGDAVVEVAEEFLDFGDDAVFAQQGGEVQIRGLEAVFS